MGSARREKKVLLILIHGIRTNAEWQHEVEIWLKNGENGKIVVAPLGYGRFDAFRFWCPILTRSGVVKTLLRKLDDLLPHYPEHEWDKIIIAHSFGTYALTKVLKNRPTWRFSEIILCGSVVSPKFRWAEVANQVSNGGRIVNDCGRLDQWPVLASALSWGYGTIGTYGVKDGIVKDRMHPIKHSEFFHRSFFEQYWKPLILEGQLVLRGQDAPSPRWFDFIQWHIKYLMLGAIGAFLWVATPLFSWLRFAFANCNFYGGKDYTLCTQVKESLSWLF
jgi:hypothetical protein